MPASSSASQAGFQQQALLGVHRQRFARADAEELGVELAGVLEEAALADVAGAGVVGVGVVEPLEVPAAVGRGTRRCRRVPSATSSQSSVGRAYPARVATGHADDRDRLAPRAPPARAPAVAPRGVHP